MEKDIHLFIRTSDKIHRSNFPFGFEERFHGRDQASNDPTGWQLEGIDTGIGEILLETYRYRRPALAGGNLEDLANDVL